MQLTAASKELFCRTKDECFSDLDSLATHCQSSRDTAQDCWKRPDEVVTTSDMTLCLGDEPDYRLNHWSFSQLCRMSGVSIDTINRLSTKTAGRALQETLPRDNKPLQFMTREGVIRSVHGASYTRLWNTELLETVRESASGFTPPQKAMTGGTGLYAGEQDMFCFLIDPTGWVEINGEAFAPGFFVWNSEVGRRSLGIQTFWFQRICQNHIVWDATEVAEFKRKHTRNVHEGLDEIRRMIDTLVAKRNERRDSFAATISKAMTEKLGDDADDVAKLLKKQGIPAGIAKHALQIAESRGAFTIFSLVDALTRITQTISYAGDRTDADTKVASLLQLAL